MRAVDKAEQQRERMRLELEIEQKNNGTYQEDLNVYQKNIKKMHEQNYRLEDELEMLRKKSDGIDDLMARHQ